MSNATRSVMIYMMKNKIKIKKLKFINSFDDNFLTHSRFNSDILGDLESSYRQL